MHSSKIRALIFWLFVMFVHPDVSLAQGGAVTVTMISPQGGAFIKETIGLAADTTNTASVTRLSFFRDAGIYLGDGVNGGLPGPNRFSMVIDTQGYVEGSHTFYAVAYTSTSSYTSAIVTAFVDNTDPTVTLLAPVAGSTVGNGVLLEATASDAFSGVKEVAFFWSNGSISRELGRVRAPPYTFRATIATPGSHAFWAQSFDKADNISYSPHVSVTVAGNVPWARNFPCGTSLGSMRAKDIAVTPDSEIVLTGAFSNSMSLGGAQLVAVGSQDIYLGKLSSSGAHLWSTRIGSTGTDESSTVAVNSTGDILLTGSLASPITWAGGTQEGGFIAKFSPSGVPLWVRSYGYYRIAAAAFDGLGNVYTAGFFYGNAVLDGQSFTSVGAYDIWVTKRSPAGELIWIKQFGGLQDDVPSAIDVDQSGNILVSGEFRGTLTFGADSLVAQGSDIFLVKLSPSGTPLWSKQLGGTGNDRSDDVHFDIDGSAIVSGITSYTATGGLGLIEKFTAAGAAAFSLPFTYASATSGYMRKVMTSVGPDKRIAFVGTMSDAFMVSGASASKSASLEYPYVGTLSPTGDLLWLESYGTGINYTNGDAVAIKPNDNMVLSFGSFGGNGTTVNIAGLPFTRVGSYDGYLYALPANPTRSVDAPHIAASLPPDGYIDALEDRDAATGALLGIKNISISFSAPVTASASDFDVSCIKNGTAANDLQTGTKPSVTQVTLTNATTHTYDVQLSQRICLGAWTEIRATRVRGTDGTALSVNANRVVFGFLPMDINQDYQINGEDIIRWRAIKDGSYKLQAPLTALMLIDQNRNGVVAGEDMVRGVQLINGIGTKQSWSGINLGTRP